jgi:hypothetical protein
MLAWLSGTGRQGVLMHSDDGVGWKVLQRLDDV